MLSSKVNLGYWNNYSHCNEAPSDQTAASLAAIWKASADAAALSCVVPMISLTMKYIENLDSDVKSMEIHRLVYITVHYSYGWKWILTLIFIPRKSLVFIHLILLAWSHRNLSDSILPMMASPLLMSSSLGAFPHFFPCVLPSLYHHFLGAMHLQLFLLTNGTFHRIFQSQVFELIWMLLS